MDITDATEGLKEISRTLEELVEVIIHACKILINAFQKLVIIYTNEATKRLERYLPSSVAGWMVRKLPIWMTLRIAYALP